MINMNLISEIRERLRAKYGEPLGIGRNREVYGNDHIVFKLPHNEYGIDDNFREDFLYHKHKDEPLAKCKILTIDDVPILVMERISYVKVKDMPEWASWYDCFQVGITKKGIFKAYDYA